MRQKWRDWQIDHILLLEPILSCAYYTNASNVVTKDMPLNVALEKLQARQTLLFHERSSKRTSFLGLAHQQIK